MFFDAWVEIACSKLNERSTAGVRQAYPRRAQDETVQEHPASSHCALQRVALSKLELTGLRYLPTGESRRWR
jgi:hypothetical protein